MQFLLQKIKGVPVPREVFHLFNTSFKKVIAKNFEILI